MWPLHWPMKTARYDCDVNFVPWHCTWVLLLVHFTPFSGKTCMSQLSWRRSDRWPRPESCSSWTRLAKPRRCNSHRILNLWCNNGGPLNREHMDVVHVEAGSTGCRVEGGGCRTTHLHLHNTYICCVPPRASSENILLHKRSTSKWDHFKLIWSIIFGWLTSSWPLQ